MRGKALSIAVFFLILSFAFAEVATSVKAQSQALNGQIEGTVLDQNGNAIVNALVTAENIEIGITRATRSDTKGIYRFAVLPLGTFNISVTASGYKKLIRDSVILAAGQNATADFELPAGEPTEVVTVSADAPIADTGRTALGRVMTGREVRSLPLVSLNTDNFVLLQPNVTGRPNRTFYYPSANANGYFRRISYQIDGNSNNGPGIAGQRLMTIADVYVDEIQFITNGFAAEFGDTPGVIMNVVTPSGTNRWKGNVNFSFRHPSFYSKPFFFPAETRLPESRAGNIAAAVGGPLVKDRWHIYVGYEKTRRDDNARANRLVTIRREDITRLTSVGLPESIFPSSIPDAETGSSLIVRTDAEINPLNHLVARFNHGDLLIENNIAGGAFTLQRGTDSKFKNYSLGAQLVSFTSKRSNEFRFQNARSRGVNKLNEWSGTGPSIAIFNLETSESIALFGSPENAPSLASSTKMTQVQDNITQIWRSHISKFGGGFTRIYDRQRSANFSRYTFRSIDRYVEARNGIRPRSYDQYEQTFGDPEIRSKSTFWNFFAQDDWKIGRKLKLAYGLRYDLYLIPEADPSSPFPASQAFNIDWNNFAPRLGVVYALREGKRPLVLRLGAGLYYDRPSLNAYQRALRNNGAPKFFSLRFSPDSGPNFPNPFGGPLPPLPQQNIDTISADFVNMYAMHANVQLEQALSENISVAIGYVHSSGRHIPIYRNINPINPVRFLADGRGVFDTAVNASTRRDPRFDVVQMVESVGVSQYDALTLQFTKRFSRGMQFSAHYTLSKATDDAPEQNVQLTGVGQGQVLSDPYNRGLDRGYSLADQRHRFVSSLVLRPTWQPTNMALRSLVNNNQISIIAYAHSGERFNIYAAQDLNRDGIIGPGITNSDRPVNFVRNSGKTPPLLNVDLRYTRSVSITESLRLEAYAEFQNLFNINSIVQFNNTSVATDTTTGEMIGSLPDFRARNKSVAQESRQIQVGFRFIF